MVPTDEVPTILASPASPPPPSESERSPTSPPALPGTYSRTTPITFPFLPPTRYRILSEPALTEELARLADPCSHSAPIGFGRGDGRFGHEGQGEARSEEETKADEASQASDLDAEMECVSFQPCLLPKAANQDRCTMADWMFGGKENGLWRFGAVFDGHGGSELAEYVVKTLPEMIRQSLQDLLCPVDSKGDAPLPSGGVQAGPGLEANDLVERVSAILRDNIIKLDNQIRDAFIDLFVDEAATTTSSGEMYATVGDEEPLSNPRIKAALEKISALSVEEIKQIINDNGQEQASSGAEGDRKKESPKRKESNHVIVTKIMRGTTALITLLDPARENLWVANLGDCQATLVSESVDSVDIDAKEQMHKKFSGELITQNHNIDNRVESDRVAGEHPGEKGVVVHNHLTGSRVLGAIMVSRSLGDFIFKLPSVFTRKVILNASPGLKVSVPVESYLERILTPPYISNIAEIHHRKLGNGEKYLILSSDGLSDLYRGGKEEDIRREWAEVVGYAGLGLGPGGKAGGQKATKKNKALELLRAAVGGGNEERVSMHLTLERDGRWMDDTTIVVMKLSQSLPVLEKVQ